MYVHDENHIQSEIVRALKLHSEYLSSKAYFDKGDPMAEIVPRDKLQSCLPFAYEVFNMTKQLSLEELTAMQEIGARVLVNNRIQQVGRLVHGYSEGEQMFKLDAVQDIFEVGRLVLQLKRTLPDEQYKQLIRQAFPGMAQELNFC